MDKKAKKTTTTKEQPKKDTVKETAPKDLKKSTELKETPKKESAPKDIQKEAALKESLNRVPPKESAPKGQPKEDPKKYVKKDTKTNLKGLTNARGARNRTKKGLKEPVEKELFTHFGKKIININGEEQDLDVNTFLKCNVIGILFTGSWVTPAKEFMAQLETLYKEVNAEEKGFEIVQISSEKSEKDYKASQTENRNWLYVPFNDPYIPKLIEQYKVEYLPKFIIVNRQMNVLSENGRKDMVECPGNKAYEKWYKEYRRIKEELQKQKEKEMGDNEDEVEES